jgi:hypothetical protein
MPCSLSPRRTDHSDWQKRNGLKENFGLNEHYDAEELVGLTSGCRRLVGFIANCVNTPTDLRIAGETQIALPRKVNVVANETYLDSCEIGQLLEN